MGSLGSPEGPSSRSPTQNQHIQVFARVRPANALEKSKHSPSIIDCPGTREVVVRDRGSAHSTKTFTFDRVFGPNSKQIDVYKTVVSPLLEQVLLGYNCTVFAYGQTGTGKTFTMEGERSPNPNLTWENDPLSGIVPRAMNQLFDELRSVNAEFTIRVSLVELYNEELYDLLAPGDDFKAKTLRLYEDANRKGSVIIQGLEEVIVSNRQDVYKIMERGSERRRTAATILNAASSRSHSVFTVLVHIRESNLDGEELVKIGKLHLVDLAGSENIGRSGAVDKRAREAGSINQSLLTLGRVITALVENAPHIPYRESKLTRILQDSLGGRTKTSIIATVSPAMMNVEETLSTLDYAHRAKNITNRPECNQKLTKKEVLKGYNDEIERLKRDLLASREKNGIFVDKDNYEKMENQILAQSQEIQDVTNAKKELEDTVTQQLEDLATRDAQLEERTDELATANKIIEELRNALEETKENLRLTKTEKEQQKLLVKKHLQTEKKLSHQAHQLLGVSEETISSLDKMHRKLERKKTVELTNLDAGKRFNKDITEQLLSLCASLENFRVGHATFCGDQRMKLENFLQIKEDLASTAKKQVEDLSSQISSMIATVLSYVEEQVNDARGGNKENAENNAKIRSALVAKFESFAKKILVKSNSLLEKVKGLDEVTKFFGDTVSSQFDGIVLSSEEFKKEMELTLAAQKSNVQSLFDEYIALEERNREQFEGQKLITESRAASMEKKMQDIITFTEQAVEEVKAWKSGLINEVNTLESNMAESGTVAKKFLNEIDSFSDTTLARTAKLNSDIGVKISTAKSLVPDFQSKVLGISQDISTTNTTINSLVGKSLECVKADFQEMEKTTNESYKLMETKLAQSHSKIDSTVKDLQNTTSDASTQILATLATADSTDTQTIQSVADNISAHCVQNSKFSDDARSHVLQQSGKMNEFWESTYLIDMPTGATPQRKVYDYPRNLSATSPHDRILTRHRLNMHENSFSEEV